MSQQVNTEDSHFKAFLPLLSIMVGAMLLIGIGISIGHQRQKDSENIQPDAKQNFSGCRMMDNQTIRIRTITSYYANTSCGYFNVPQNMVSQMVEGVTYDLVVTYPHGDRKGYGYISESIPAAR